jgi:hypothetical protein
MHSRKMRVTNLAVQMIPTTWRSHAGWLRFATIFSPMITSNCLDDDRETAWDCYRHYRGIGHADPAIFKRVASLTFADDQYFSAFQAADMVAFLSRLEAKSRFYGDRYDFRRLFNYLTTSKKHIQWFEMFADEATIRSLSESFKKS